MCNSLPRGADAGQPSGKERSPAPHEKCSTKTRTILLLCGTEREGRRERLQEGGREGGKEEPNRETQNYCTNKDREGGRERLGDVDEGKKS